MAIRDRDRPAPRLRPPERIAFVHIPKTAGNTVLHAFQQAFGDSACDGFRTAIDDAAFSAARFVSGHVHLSSVRAQDAFVFTFLREPVAQLASHLRHLDRYSHPDFAGYATAFSAGLKQTIACVAATDFGSAAALDGFLHRLPAESDVRLINVHCEVLAASPGWRCPPAPELAALAIDRLARLDFIGVVEQADRDMARLFRRLHLPGPPVLSWQNSQDTARPIDLANPAIHAVLARHVAADLVLYRHVTRRYRWWRRWRLG